MPFNCTKIFENPKSPSVRFSPEQQEISKTNCNADEKLLTKQSQNQIKELAFPTTLPKGHQLWLLSCHIHTPVFFLSPALPTQFKLKLL